MYNMDMAEPNKSVARLLKSKGLTVSCAESCTGGLLSALLTATPGSSQYFKGAVIAYDNIVKRSLLKVPKNLITRYGAVSKEVTLAMAQGARKLFKTDISVGITGVAGPGGGTKEKPIGLVYIALAGPARKITKKFIFSGTRHAIRRKATDAALRLMRR